ncbi:hypothetical protein [Streptomyces sp. NPDC057253]|uniref:hypothetical protein n=1 Tax=Streptomyces sp. NPDC057253 TaxID=3346069 RepID=UPI0036411318
MTKGHRAMRMTAFGRKFRKPCVSSRSGPVVIGSEVVSERGLFGFEQALEFSISRKGAGRSGRTRRDIRRQFRGEPHGVLARRTVHGRFPPPVHCVLGFRRLSGGAAGWHRRRPLPGEAVCPLPPHVSGMGHAERAVVTGPFLKHTASGPEFGE